MRLTILGSGPGGYVAAIRAAQLGAKVTVIEEQEVGGVCLNVGCIPTKTMVASAELLAKVRELDSFGIDLAGTVSPNLSKIMERKNKVVSTQVRGIRSLFKSWGIAVIEGRGRLVSPREIEISLRDGEQERIDTDSLIIATGSRPAVIPAFPFDGANIISSTDALELTEVPKSLLVIGAGVIGSEFACIYRELGAEVTMVEMMDRALATEDREISELFEKELRKRRIKLFTSIKVEKVDIRPDGVHVKLSDGKELTAEKVLVSIGRAFNSDRLGLEDAGIKKGRRGEIVVNEKMETSAQGVYAIGDVVGGPLLAHVASTQGITAAQNVMGLPSEMDYRVVPAAIFTSPEIASVGLREQEAEEKGIAVRVGSFPFRSLGKAHAIGEIAGFVKIIADRDSDKVLGGHIIGPHASDIIHEIALAMKAGLTARDVAHTIHAHPTLSEGIMEAAEAVHGQSIHIPKK